MSESPDKKGRIEWFVDSLKEAADKVLGYVDIALIRLFEPLLYEVVKRQNKQDKQAQEVHLRAELETSREGGRRLDQLIESQLQQAVRLRELEAIYIVAGEFVPDSAIEQFNVISEYVAEVRQKLAENIAAHGTAFPASYLEHLGYSSEEKERLDAKVKQVLAKDALERLQLGLPVPEDLQARLGIEIPQRDSDTRDKSK